MKEINAIVKQNASNIRRLGSFSSENLAKGFSEEEHSSEFNSLIDYCGNYFPIAILEKAVKHYRAKSEECKRNIVEQMFASDIDSFSMNGETYSIKTEYSPEFPDGDRQAFYDWLIENGHGAVVKSILTMPKIDEAEFAKKVLRDAGLNVNVVRQVHHQTLRKTIRELVDNGESGGIPVEVVNIKPFDVLTIKIK